MIGIITKIEWFVASETSCLQKYFTRTCRQLLKLSAKFVVLSLSHNSIHIVVYSFIAYGSSKNWTEHYKSSPIH